MSSYEVEVVHDEAEAAELADAVSAAARATLDHQQVPEPAALTVLFADDARLQELNRAYLGEDAATDVLSFPAGAEVPGAEGYLGDIAISLPTAKRQADAGGHSLAAELQLLTVHGVLHLLGYDHAEPGQKDAMWIAQAGVLGELGLDIAPPDEPE